MLDPAGGQGLDLIPGWREIAAPIIDGIGGAGSAQQIANATKFPGKATYITYDSGNLPLLERFNGAPRLLNIFPSFEVPMPLTDSLEDALRKVVNTGYQDVDPVTLERKYNMGGHQANLWHSPLTPTQQLAATQTVFNTLVDGIEANALTLAKWRTKFPGADLSALTENATTEAGAKALAGRRRRCSEESDRSGVQRRRVRSRPGHPGARRGQCAN